MSREQQNAVLQEALDQSWQYRQFAATRNGLNIVPPRNTIGDSFPPLVEPQPVEPKPAEPDPIEIAPVNSQTTIERETVTKVRDKTGGWLKPLLAGAAITAGSLGAAGGAAYLGYRALQPAPTPPAAPSENDAILLDIERYGDLLKYLRENGYNLPPQ